MQPVDPLELWTTPPFDAQVRDGKIYGRGTVDDKGQVLMHVAAIEAHLRNRGRLPLNVKVVVEGEEEVGSPSFEASWRASANGWRAMPSSSRIRRFSPKTYRR